MGDSRAFRTVALAAVIAALTCAGCLTDGAYQTRRRALAPTYGPVQVRGQTYSATVAVGDGYLVNVDIATQASCTRTRTPRTRVTTRREKKYFVGSYLAFAYGGVAFVAGAPLYFIPASDFDEVNDDGKSTRQVVGKYIMYAGAGLALSPILWKALSGSGSVTSRVERGSPMQEPMACPAGTAEPTGTIVVRAPWGHEATSVLAGGRAQIRMDWGSSNIDPLDPNATSQLAGAWGVWSADGKYRGTWSPSPADVDKMRYAIGAAVGIEMDAQRGGARPALSIKRLEIGDGGVANAGERVQIKLTLQNNGRGPAYRVVATTKSGMTALRNLHFSFGLIQPGQSKSRTVVVDVPRQERESREPIIFQIKEYNGNAPRARTEQVTVRPSVRPAMRLACHLEGPRKNEAGQPSVDAGRSFAVVCNIDNTGGAPAKNVTMSVRMARREWSAKTSSIGPNRSSALRVQVTVPKTAQLDERYPIDVTVSETNFNTSESWSSAISAGTPSVCPQKLTDAQYREKRSKLEKLRDEGILTDSEFDKRHAELVDCLQ